MIPVAAMLSLSSSLLGRHMRPVVGAALHSMHPVMSATPPVAERVPHTVRFGKVAGENRGIAPMEPAIELQVLHLVILVVIVVASSDL